VLIIDERARAVIAARKAAGRDGTLFLRVRRVPSRGVPCSMLVVSWAPRCWPQRHLVARQVDDTRVILDARIARYTLWHDIVITLWRLGPWSRLEVRDELPTLLDLEDWEQAHPLTA
jgi:hypothetical protein